MREAIFLSHTQAEQLLQVCAAYRSYAWQRLDPCEERNRIMKAVQSVQGRLAEWSAGGGEPGWFALTEEERNILRLILGTLLQVYGAEAASADRNQALAALATIRVLVERGCQPTQAR
jgi:hypothetical protein